MCEAVTYFSRDVGTPWSLSTFVGSPSRDVSPDCAFLGFRSMFVGLPSRGCTACTRGKRVFECCWGILDHLTRRLSLLRSCSAQAKKRKLPLWVFLTLPNMCRRKRWCGPKGQWEPGSRSQRVMRRRHAPSWPTSRGRQGACAGGGDCGC